MSVSPRLERFKQKSENLWNFRCNICGDSRKNKYKARAYFFKRKDSLFFSCHNCSTNLSFRNWLKAFDQNLYQEYQLEDFKNKAPIPVQPYKAARPVFDTNKKVNIDLPNIESLDNSHPAKKFLVSRMVPPEHYAGLYWASDFGAFIKKILPDYEKELRTESRIVFPFYSEQKHLLGVTARVIDDSSSVKYITIKFDDDNEKIYGLDKVNFARKLYIVEGPIDSLFLNNSLAMMDAHLHKIISMKGAHDYVFVHDNEPRNPQIVKIMADTIRLNQSICIWPKDIKQKDINDMVLSGLNRSLVQDIIDKNTFSGIRAKLEFEKWKKI